MIHVGVVGANGRMGRALIEAIHEDKEAALAFANVRRGSAFVGIDAGEVAGLGKIGQLMTVDRDAKGVDVMIDFTLPSALGDNLTWCVNHKIPTVIGTTGLNEKELQLLEQASQHIPIVFAANYSVGINLFLNLVRKAASVLGNTADIEIIETHHRFKKDAPSGTALAIGEAIADELGRDLSSCAVYGREGETGERKQDTIGFATVRAGDVIGEHTALFADIGERFELTHKSSSRLIYAKGAIRAARFLLEQQSGLFDMEQVLGLK